MSTANAATTRRAFRALGCDVAIVVDAPCDPTRLARAELWFRACEQQLSRFRPDSELCRLNATPGRAVKVSPLLWTAMVGALDAARWTDGLVHPAVLPALEHAGYDRDFARVAAAGAGVGAPARPTPGLGDWRQIELDAAQRTIRLPVGVRVDLGGTAKGWFADVVAARLAPFGPVLVDAGGDIAVAGARAAGWPIAIGSPLPDAPPLRTVSLRRGGIATSGRDHRRWQRDGVWQHHIIDPRTGAPAVTDVLSATVVGPSAFAAEVAAKVVLLRGIADGIAWLDARPEFAGLAVDEHGSVRTSARFPRG